MATVDHVKCVLDAATKEEYNAPANKVLACFQCNQERNDAFLATNPCRTPTFHRPPRKRQPVTFAMAEVVVPTRYYHTFY